MSNFKTYFLIMVCLLLISVWCTQNNTEPSSETLTGKSEDIQKEIEHIIENSTIEEVISDEEIQRILEEIERLAQEAGVQ